MTNQPTLFSIQFRSLFCDVAVAQLGAGANNNLRRTTMVIV